MNGNPISTTDFNRRWRQQVCDAVGTEYEIVRQLSSGSMSLVYEAIETRLQRRVALKVLHPVLADDPRAVDRFLGEARTAARLEQHANIVRIFKIDQRPGLCFFTMSLVAGETLREVLTRKIRMGEAQVVGILRQLLEALQFIHERGVVHCDVKPENVLIDEDGQLVLIDFGIARVTGANAAHNRTTLIGTPSYMSPEQVSGARVGRQSDLYSAGVMVFEMLTGELPIMAENTAALLMKQVFEQPPSLTELRRSLAPELSGLADQMLSKEPALRPMSARTALTAISALPAAPIEIQRGVPNVAVPQLVPVAPIEQTRETPLPTSEWPAPVPPGETVRVRVPPPVVRIESGRRFRPVYWLAVLVLSAGLGVAFVEFGRGRAAATIASAPQTQAPRAAKVSAVPPADLNPRKSKVNDAPVVAKATRTAMNAPEMAKAAPTTFAAPPTALMEDGDGPASAAETETDSRLWSIPVQHDHVAGSCSGRLVMRQDSLEFVSERDKDSRQWDYAQIRKVNRKGSQRLEFSTSEKDIKKLGFMSRSYKFDMLDSGLPPQAFDYLLSQTKN